MSGWRDPAVRSALNLARDVLADLDLDAVLARALASARELCQAKYAALGVLDQARPELERFITIGLDQDARQRIGALPRGYGILGLLIAQPQPLRLDDIAKHPRAFGFPAGHPPMKSFLGVPITVAGEPVGNLYLAEKASGRDFTDEDQAALEVLAELAGLAIDHARRYAGLQDRHAELQRTIDTLNASQQIAHTLDGQADQDAILELVATQARTLVSARAVAIEHAHEDQLTVAATAGELPDTLRGQQLDPQQSLEALALRHARTLRLEEPGNRQPFEHRGLGRHAVHAQAGVIVPLISHGQPLGALVAVDRELAGPTFTPDDQRLLETLAASLATALATARAAHGERRSQRLAAAERERERWAAELHDHTLQSLAAIRIALTSQLRARNPDRTAQVILDTVRQIDTETSRLRSLLTELRPATLDQLGLKAALDALTDRARRHGLQVHARIDLQPDQQRPAQPHDQELHTTLYRITQEALTNAAQHAHASRALIHARQDPDTITISIRDNGHGFDPTAPTDGYGLLAMRERAELLNGTLTINSAPRLGTTITATIPTQHRARHPETL